MQQRQRIAYLEKRIHFCMILTDLSNVIGENNVTEDDYQDQDSRTRVRQQVDDWLIQEWKKR